VTMHIPKWLIATAGFVLVMLIGAVAFFIGSETSRPTAVASAPEEAKLPPAEAGGAAASSSATPSSVATPSSASTPGPAAESSQTTPEARARVAAYFKQMEAIQSAGQTGDPQEFASTVVNAAGNGDFSAIDDLVRAAGDAERRAAALQPPAECAEYHRMAVTLLQESRTMMTSLRDGLKRKDTDALTSLSASAQQMKSRAEDLAKAEKALRARFGL